MKILHIMLGMMLSIVIAEAVDLEAIREKTPNWSTVMPLLQDYSGINYGPAIGQEPFTMAISVSSNNNQQFLHSMIFSNIKCSTWYPKIFW